MKRTTRQQSRQKINEVFERAFSKVIPADERIPLRGRTFSDFEDQVEEAGRAVMSVMLEERAVLDAAAWQANPGTCPHCASDRVYLEKELSIRDVRSPVGLLKVSVQNCRCRACDGSFSPSDARLATAQ
jgi:hypothetical protein